MDTPLCSMYPVLWSGKNAELLGILVSQASQVSFIIARNIFFWQMRP